MGKRIGSYISPTTSEEDWFEPDTVNMLLIQPRMVTKVGEVNQSPIDFKLDCTPDEENITVTAEYTNNSKKYTSKPILIPSLFFADNFKDLIYADKSLEESDIIKDACDKASQDLTTILMDNNILMGGMQFEGFGYVFADNDKIMTLESIDFNYSVESGKGIYSAIIRNCVSQASLQNIENPEIKLWNGSYRVELVSPQVTISEEGRLKEYTLSMTNINVIPDSTMPEHKIYESININDETFLDEFIANRKTLLDDLLENDSDLDDRFDDIFN